MFKSLLRKFLHSIGYDVIAVQEAEVARMQAKGLSVRDCLLQDALVLQQGELSLTEAQFLFKIVSECSEPGPIIEVGTLYAWSTRIMICAKQPERHLISVDNYSWNPLGLAPDLHYAVTARILEPAREFHNVELQRISKNDFYSVYKGERPAVVFLDADHSYTETKRDIEWALSIGAQVICGHDYDRESFPGVVQAVDELGGLKDCVETLWVLNTND